MLGIALFGAGRIGRMHAEIVATTAGSHLVCVYDVVPEAARAIADRHGVETATSIETAPGRTSTRSCSGSSSSGIAKPIALSGPTSSMRSPPDGRRRSISKMGGVR